MAITQVAAGLGSRTSCAAAELFDVLSCTQTDVLFVLFNVITQIKIPLRLENWSISDKKSNASEVTRADRNSCTLVSYEACSDYESGWCEKAQEVRCVCAGIQPQLVRQMFLSHLLAGSHTCSSCCSTNIPWQVSASRQGRLNKFKTLIVFKGCSGISLGWWMPTGCVPLLYRRCPVGGVVSCWTAVPARPERKKICEKCISSYGFISLWVLMDYLRCLFLDKIFSCFFFLHLKK